MGVGPQCVRFGGHRHESYSKRQHCQSDAQCPSGSEIIRSPIRHVAARHDVLSPIGAPPPAPGGRLCAPCPAATNTPRVSLFLLQGGPSTWLDRVSVPSVFLNKICLSFSLIYFC